MNAVNMLTDALRATREQEEELKNLRHDYTAANDQIREMDSRLAAVHAQNDTLIAQNAELLSRLEKANQRVSYFQERSANAVRKAAELASEMGSLLVEDQTHPSIIQDEPSAPVPTVAPAAKTQPREVTKMLLAPDEIIEIDQIPDGAEFHMTPPDSVRSKNDLYKYYRDKCGTIPTRLKKRPDIIFRKVSNSEILFLRFMYEEDRNESRRPFSGGQALPKAGNIPAADAGGFNSHGQLGDNGDEIPRFLRKPINGGDNGAGAQDTEAPPTS